MIIKGMTSCREDDNVMYSASVVLNAISVYSFLDQYIRQSAYVITKPGLDVRLLLSLCGGSV